MPEETVQKTKYDEFIELVTADDDAFGKDLGKFFEKEQNAAGKRIRAKAQELIVWLKQLKKDVSTTKQSRKASKTTA